MKQTKEARQDVKFYVTLVLGFTLLIMGFFAEPPGDINSSIIIASGILFSIGSMAVGINLEGIIRELRLLKNESINEIKQEAKEDE